LFIPRWKERGSWQKVADFLKVPVKESSCGKVRTRSAPVNKPSKPAARQGSNFGVVDMAGSPCSFPAARNGGAARKLGSLRTGALKVKRVFLMRSKLFMTALLSAAALAGPSQAQDASAGEKVFAKCKACHVANEAKNKVGPSLLGVIGRTAGTVEGFKYSPAMVDAGKGGLVWDEAKLTEYLHAPKEVVKGTKMAFAGLKADADILNLIAYLKQFPKP
jgi:cytochrome c